MPGVQAYAVEVAVGSGMVGGYGYDCVVAQVVGVYVGDRCHGTGS